MSRRIDCFAAKLALVWALACALCVHVSNATAASHVYISTTAGGLPLYTSEPLDAGARLYMSVGDPPPRPPQRRETWPGVRTTGARAGAYASLPDHSIERLVVAASLAYGVPDALLLAVMHAESNFNPAARSPVGAIGLMQVMPPTGQRYGVRSGLADPLTNIDVGARYLKDLLELFNGNKELAVAAYNAGEGAVIKHGRRIPPYAETRAYVPRVMQLYARYSARRPS